MAKKPDLIKEKFLQWLILSKRIFFTLEVKKPFIYLQKVFIKVLIFCYFDSKCYICIETDTLEYDINKVLYDMTLDQHFSTYITYKDLISSRSKIGQCYFVTFFSQKKYPLRLARRSTI